VAAVHEYSAPNSGTNWNLLVYVYEQSDLGYFVNTGCFALNGLGSQGQGNYAGTPETVTALNRS